MFTTQHESGSILDFRSPNMSLPLVIFGRDEITAGIQVLERMARQCLQFLHAIDMEEALIDAARNALARRT